MADLTVTAANVLKVAGATQVTGVAGEDITAGEPLYKDLTAASVLKLCDADAAVTAVIAGVALNAALTGQPVTYVSVGDYNPGATVVVGETYVASVTPGGVAPIADLLTGDYTSIIGIATTTANINVSINNSGVAQG